MYTNIDNKYSNLINYLRLTYCGASESGKQSSSMSMQSANQVPIHRCLADLELMHQVDDLGAL